MPEAWSAKDERMYDHVKQSELERGKGRERAEEIAARTVNKQRRREGRTESGKQTTEGTGNPHSPLEQRTYAELYNRAKELQIRGRSDMKKAELIDAIRSRQ
ncbi:MAG: Rho termination factor N-terminal domain-containing protein [Planctomycetota bacterium]